MEKRFMKGCEAIAEAAVRGGCRFFAGYPITPQNESPEYRSWRLPEVGGAFVQGESEHTPTVRVVELMEERVKIGDTDKGKEITGRIEDLRELMQAYRNGYIKET